MERFQITDRANDLVQTLSGGLKRRVEIAKSLLHNPRVLLLDEPSTGLDPGARFDLWRALQTLRAESGVTVLVTTHLMEEAEKCDRLVILDRGKLAAMGTPDELRSKIGGDCITIQAFDSDASRFALAKNCTSTLQITPQLFETQLRIEAPEGAELVHRLTKAVFVQRSVRSRSASRRWKMSSFERPGIGSGMKARFRVLSCQSSVVSQTLRGQCDEPEHDAASSSRVLWRDMVLPISMLVEREFVRFFRQRSRVVGALAQPVIFWVLFGAGLSGSFRMAAASGGSVSFQEYFLPGAALMIVLFTSIFSSISVIQDRNEGFLQGVLAAPVPRRVTRAR